MTCTRTEQDKGKSDGQTQGEIDIGPIDARIEKRYAEEMQRPKPRNFYRHR
jgi:hypothetical protein